MSPPPFPTPSSSSASERTLHGDHDGSTSPATCTETTPLLLEDGTAADRRESKPLPTMQILLLCFARLMEPIAFFAVFPFIAQMVGRNGNLPDSDIGFYSGLIESLFSVVQVLVLIFWGRLADTIGRKPVIIISLVGMTVGTFAYTMSTSIWQMIFFRCVAGLFSGSNLVLRTAISDHCTQETQAVVFSWFSFAGNVGIFIGPLLGGVLADPVEQYPAIFGGIAFFQTYPYALVGFALTALSVVGIIVSAMFLEETLKPEEDDSANDVASARTADSSDSADSTVAKPSTPRQPKPTIMELLRAPGVAVVIWVYTHFLLLAFAFTAILPVVLYTPVEIGGFGFTPFQISLYMAIQGASQALWLILVFPFAQRRFGTNGVLRICANTYPLFFSFFILVNAFLRVDSPTAMSWAWIVGLSSATIGPGISMAFTGVQLAVNDVSPNPHVLGTLNAVAMTSASAIRSFVPGVATAVFAIGVRSQIFSGYLAWVVLIPIAMSLTVFLKHMPERPLDDTKKFVERED